MGGIKQLPLGCRWFVIALAIGLLFAAAPIAAKDGADGNVSRDCDACSEMEVIPAGSFVMGEDELQR